MSLRGAVGPDRYSYPELRSVNIAVAVEVGPKGSCPAPSHADRHLSAYREGRPEERQASIPPTNKTRFFMSMSPVRWIGEVGPLVVNSSRWSGQHPPHLWLSLLTDMEQCAVRVHIGSRTLDFNVSLEAFRCADPLGDSVWCPRSMTVNP